MKRILAIMLVVILLFSVVSCTKNPEGLTEEEGESNVTVKHEYTAPGTTDTFEYDVNEEGNYEITKFSSANATLHTVTIPAEIGGIPVTGIADEVSRQPTK